MFMGGDGVQAVVDWSAPDMSFHAISPNMNDQKTSCEFTLL